MGSQKNLADIKAIILDVDGVLTDGRIGYSADANEIKYFHVQDGHRLVMALRAGLKVGILSGRRSRANRTRAEELHLSFLVEGCLNKLDGWNQILTEQHLKPEECMYIGDDVVDIPPMRRCGFAVAVANACPETKAVADYVTPSRGGEGAVRDAVEYLLKGQNRWQELLERYYC